MICIKIPQNNIQERMYIIGVMFNEFLGLDYQIEVSIDESNYSIELANGNKLIFEDHFFNKFPNNLEYLNYKNLPLHVMYFHNQFIPERDIPILYGQSKLEINNEKFTTIVCGIDIFAASFFMLTRWEEYINKKRDSHDRFLAVESVAFKNDFLDRPIVNEYIEMLKNMLLYLGLEQKLKKRDYQLFVSCDVDQPFDCTVENLKNLIRVCLGDILKRKNIKEFIKRVRRYIFNQLENYRYDENYTFEWYLDVCETVGAKVAFYFIPNSNEKGNACYELKDKKIQELLKYLSYRGHEIGVHGSYQTYQDKDKARKQKSMLDETLNKLGISQKVVGNRQHYLRWDSSTTPSVLDYAGFEYDTTGSYADRAGFRYGVCYEFSMFDFLSRQKLNLKQKPLIVMECSILDKNYLGVTYTKALEIMQDLKSKCYQYGGNFILLWHNSHLKAEEDRKLFKELIK